MVSRSRQLTVFSILVASAAVPRSDAGPRLSARIADSGLGSSIALSYTLQHGALAPESDVTLLACVTNQNRHSSRDVQSGDSFRFDFPDGVVVGCSGLTTFPDPGLAAGDFTCESDASSVTFVYGGASMPWPAGAGACAQVTYHVGAKSSGVITSLVVGNRGAYSAPEPLAVLLSVAPGLMPPGLVGPPGPAGPPGTPGVVGARVMALSTGNVFARPCDYPLPVPGLDATITTAAGSQLLVAVEAQEYFWCPGMDTSTSGRSEGRLQLELDGITVAQDMTPFRFVNIGGALGQNNLETNTMVWLSPPLTAGAHAVRVFLETTAPCPGRDPETACIGHSDAGERSRLVVVELPN